MTIYDDYVYTVYLTQKNIGVGKKTVEKKQKKQGKKNK